MWRRAGAGPVRLHLVAAAGYRVRRRPLPPLPTIPSPSSAAAASSSGRHDVGIFCGSVGAPCRAQSSEAGGGGCWNCGAAGAFLSCGSCGSVQPIDPAVDYFRIFGLERKYDIKENSLEGKYKDWQKKLHPDVVHTKSEKERGFAAEQSALVIDAYHTLMRPLSRALYLLKLEGIQVHEEKTINDPELLMEIWRYVKQLVTPLIPKPWRRSNLRLRESSKPGPILSRKRLTREILTMQWKQHRE